MESRIDFPSLLNVSTKSINSSLETEEILGPLPSNWTRAQDPQTGKHYFVDKKAKKTTWVDPRTYRLRKHRITEVVPGELPYGWEEQMDPKTGTVIYVDHLTKRNYWKAPWEKDVQQDVSKLQDRITSQARMMQQDQDWENKKERLIRNAEREIEELEKQRRVLERALKAGADRASCSEEDDEEVKETEEREELNSLVALIHEKLKLKGESGQEQEQQTKNRQRVARLRQISEYSMVS
jgi:hypothetical protein